MKLLDDLIERLENFDSKVLFVVERTLRLNKDIIIDMNVEEQLYEKGINRLGVEIIDYKPYRPFTISVKRIKGQPTTKVTLRDTEDFHKSFFITFTSVGFEISATDEKTQSLVKKYGKEIFGLTDDNFLDLAVNYVALEIGKLFKSLTIRN